ncbi:MAG: CHAD domain-containing protein [Actinomycetia bacterium]|nr:CHAD domain-containing protein [Actinomycetes bacterium]
MAIEALDHALHLLESLAGADPDAIEEGVHEVRKRTKEVRGLARMLRPALGHRYRRFNTLVGDAATELSSIRDAHVVLDTFEHLREAAHRPNDPKLDRIGRQQARLARHATRSIQRGDVRIHRAHALLGKARRRVLRWEIDGGFEALAGGLETTYRRGRRGLRRARNENSDDSVHQWRKAVKHLWYEVRLLEESAPSVLSPLVGRLDELAESLGNDHDLAVLIERVVADPDRFGTGGGVKRTVKLARRRQQDLRAHSFRLGATIYAESPGAFNRRMAAYWAATTELGPEPPVHPTPPIPTGTDPT